MSFSPYAEMQKAVDIVNTSLHPTNKIAATLSGTDQHGGRYSISQTNYWPAPIREKFSPDARIGNSSGTIHAETACILMAPYTQGASIFITDPFCPNCAKNIAEAGIKNIYIDHKGFEKDFAARRADAFDDMSLQICQKAGINVYRIHRKEERIETIWQTSDDYVPDTEQPVAPRAVGRASQDIMQQSIAAFAAEAGRRAFAVALARDADSGVHEIAAWAHPAVGYMTSEKGLSMPAAQGKYSFILEPSNRLLMNAPRLGLKIIDGYFYASKVPTARELVNIVGAGLTKITVGSETTARDHFAFMALEQLKEAKILSASVSD